MVSYAAMPKKTPRKNRGKNGHLHFAAALVLPQDALGIHRGGIATRRRASREQTLVIVICYCWFNMFNGEELGFLIVSVGITRVTRVYDVKNGVKHGCLVMVHGVLW